MKRATMLVFVLVALASRVEAQAVQIADVPNSVVIETLREMRKLLPEGKIGVESDEFRSASAADSVAARIGLVAGPKRQLRECGPALKECRFKGVVGTLGVRGVHLNGEEVVVTVVAIQANEVVPTDFYTRFYEVTLRRTHGSRWEVVSYKMTWES